DRSVGYFGKFQLILVQYALIVFKLTSDDKSFKKCPAQINRNTCSLVDSKFLIELLGDVGGSPSQFDNVYKVRAAIYKILGFPKAKTFVHSHSKSRGTWLLSPYRDILQHIIHVFII